MKGSPRTTGGGVTAISHRRVTVIVLYYTRLQNNLHVIIVVVPRPYASRPFARMRHAQNRLTILFVIIVLQFFIHSFFSPRSRSSLAASARVSPYCYHRRRHRRPASRAAFPGTYVNAPASRVYRGTSPWWIVDRGRDDGTLLRMTRRIDIRARPIRRVYVSCAHQCARVGTCRLVLSVRRVG